MNKIHVAVTGKCQLTNDFALAFLMPEETYRRIAQKNTQNGKVNTAAVANYFHVTVSDAAARGVQLGILKAW